MLEDGTLQRRRIGGPQEQIRGTQGQWCGTGSTGPIGPHVSPGSTQESPKESITVTLTTDSTWAGSVGSGIRYQSVACPAITSRKNNDPTWAVSGR